MSGAINASSARYGYGPAERREVVAFSYLVGQATAAECYGISQSTVSRWARDDPQVGRYAARQEVTPKDMGFICQQIMAEAWDL